MISQCNNVRVLTRRKRQYIRVVYSIGGGACIVAEFNSYILYKMWSVLVGKVQLVRVNMVL